MKDSSALAGAVTCSEESLAGRTADSAIRMKLPTWKSFVLLVLVALLIGARGEAESLAADEQAGQALEKIYRNEKSRYSVRYPASWFPSGITYGNAFEIRNYDPHHPQARPERDRSNLLIVDMTMESQEAVAGFLDDLVAQRANAEREVMTLAVDGHRAVRVRQLVNPQQLSRGVPRRPGAPPPAPGPPGFIDLSTYIANGSDVLRLWATVPEGGDPTVIAEVLQIEGSVAF